MAGAIGTSSSEKDGLLSSEQYNWLNLIVKTVGTTDTLKYVKINVSSKLSMMCCTIGNFQNSGVLYISKIGSEEPGSSEFQAEWIRKPTWTHKFYYVNSGTSYDLYIGEIQPWGQCSIIRLTGTVNSSTPVQSVPEDAVEVTISD